MNAAMKIAHSTPCHTRVATSWHPRLPNFQACAKPTPPQLKLTSQAGVKLRFARQLGQES